MPIPIYTTIEINAIARAGELVWDALNQLIEACRPGVTTRQIDDLAAALLNRAGANSLASGESTAAGKAFPGSCCVCVNEEVAHAVPSERIIRAGDIISIDLTTRVEGWWADACRTAVVGEGDAEAEKLARTAKAALETGISMCQPGRRWSEVAGAIVAAATGAGCRLIPALAGHGIGRALHEPPTAWLASRDADFVLQPGMVLTIEPILTRGSARTVTLDDGWTVLTADRARGAAEERTIAVTRDGPLVLTGPGE